MILPIVNMHSPTHNNGGKTSCRNDPRMSMWCVLLHNPIDFIFLNDFRDNNDDKFMINLICRHSFL